MTLVTHLDTKLDLHRLETTLESLMVENPILKARMEHKGDWLEWVYDPVVTASKIIKVHHNVDESEFCFGKMNPHKAPLWEINVSRKGEEDVLALSMAHALGDGKALMALFGMIAERYNVPNHVIQNPPSSLPSRDITMLFLDDDEIRRRACAATAPHSPWPSLYEHSVMKGGHLAIKTMDPLLFSESRRHWKREAGATVNDILMAAMALALRDMTGKSRNTIISGTVDNRQFIKRDVPTIANLSSNFAINLGDISGMGMAETIAIVHRSIEELRKEDRLGKDDLATYANIHSVEEMDRLVSEMYESSESGTALYFLSNVGELSWTNLGRLTPKTAYVAYPGIRPPTLGVVSSSYLGVLYLTMGHYAGLPAARADELLSRMIDHLRV